MKTWTDADVRRIAAVADLACWAARAFGRVYGLMPRRQRFRAVLSHGRQAQALGRAAEARPGTVAGACYAVGAEVAAALEEEAFARAQEA